MKQTDFSGKIRKYGCLWFCLMEMAEKAGQTKLSRANIIHMYDHLQTRGYMNQDCYIYDHAAVANEALSYMIKPDIRIKYVGAQYLDKPEKSWGKNEGDYIIFQTKTENVPGHFICLNYNPYYPPSKILSIRSVRYYEKC